MSFNLRLSIHARSCEAIDTSKRVGKQNGYTPTRYSFRFPKRAATGQFREPGKLLGGVMLRDVVHIDSKQIDGFRGPEGAPR